MEADAPVRVALTQMRCSEDPRVNLQRQLALVDQAGRGGARIICTQELFRSRYFCQEENHTHFALAEAVPGPTTQALGELARQHKAVIVASLFERRAAGIYHNTAAIIEQDGSLAGLYRKMHIPDDPLFYEKFYFAPGDTGFRTWETSRGKLGVLVCWDQWYPEAARATALGGAEILFYPSAIGWHPSEKAEFGEAQRQAWETMHRSHAIANGCFVCAVNRVGHERLAGVAGEGLEFWGGSLVVAPDGQVTHRASEDREEVVLADLDLSRVEFSRVHWPFFRDRRTDAYGDLLRRWGEGGEGASGVIRGGRGDHG